MGASKSGGGGRRYTPKPLELNNPTSVLCWDQLKNQNSVKRAKSNDRLNWTHRFSHILVKAKGNNPKLPKIAKMANFGKKKYIKKKAKNGNILLKNVMEIIQKKISIIM